MKTLNCELDLAYPPISNQEGVWFWEDEEVREYVKSSKIYMIVHRKQLKFKDVCWKPKEFGVIKFKIIMGDIVSPEINLSIKFAMDYKKQTGNSVYIEMGDKLIRITGGDKKHVIYWATPDIFLDQYFKDKFLFKVEDDFDFKVFNSFELYYVAISKENDSFSRLFGNVHHGRLKILSNETQKEKEARLTDELMILMFNIRYFNINTVDHIGNLNYYIDDDKLVVADAEKAFVKLMNTKYNEVKYEKYPYSKDGLYTTELDRYVYSINEEIVIYTDELEFSGSYGSDEMRDIIMIEGDRVEIIKF
ncbi:hypothetical protein ACJDU8_21490 [Clostridium sp. WILCCON 0269]|uniref:DUF2262 domain-containing protein n=1 Tax=Candidatus Clostridium eludens TaxID=3381663 RepID=A0ABW8SQQ4_9CLOT